MGRYSPRGGGGGGGRYDSPPRRGYGNRGRSPPRRGGHGDDRQSCSLLVRNIPLSTRGDDLRTQFERFGPVRDVYLPKDYYTGDPRGFAFVEFIDGRDASEAQYHMNRQIFFGREITVVLAAETRKRPDEMRTRETRPRGSRERGSRRSYRGRSRSRSYSKSPSPRYRERSRSRSYSPAPRRREEDYSPLSPRFSRSPRPRHDEIDTKRSPLPRYVDKSPLPPRGSHSRSADVSPARSG